MEASRGMRSGPVPDSEKGSGPAVGLGLAYITFGLYSCNDAILKSFGGGLPIFEVLFFSTFFSIVLVVALKPREERLRDIFRMRDPLLVLARAGCVALMGMLSVFAFTTILLADVYALLFLSPVYVLLLSALVLREEIGRHRLAATGLSLLGALLVVRPGFRELGLGHLAASLIPIAGAVNVIIMRKIGKSESQITLVGVAMAGTLVLSGILMTPSFRLPHPGEWIRLVASGCLVATGQLVLLSALRRSAANVIGPAQYSQIVWAILLGAFFFQEFPDWLALTGMMLIIISGGTMLLRAR